MKELLLEADIDVKDLKIMISSHLVILSLLVIVRLLNSNPPRYRFGLREGSAEETPDGKLSNDSEIQF